MAVKLIYRDIAFGAAEGAQTETTTAETFSDKEKILDGVENTAVATCELNGWGLSRDYSVLSNQQIAFWSKAKSGADCIFTTPPTITFTFDAQYAATGLTLRFAPASMDYCTKARITWYQGGTVLYSGVFDIDTPIYELNNTVIAFDKINIEFLQTSLPLKRCKVEQILIGIIREFNADELRRVSEIHEVDLISEKMPANVLDADIRSKRDIDYLFQRKQPVESYDNGVLIGVYYIENGKRAGRYDFSISCHDAIGLLGLAAQPGGLFLEDTPLETVLNDIFGDAVTFEIDTAYKDATIRGFIPPDLTAREALHHIAFSLGAVVDTSGTYNIKIFPPPITSADISPKKTYAGGRVDTADKVTEVTVTAYAISDTRPGDNDTSIEYNGVKYKYYTETKHAYNKNRIASDPEKKIKFDKVYLCNLSNAQTLADNIMAYYERRNTYKFDHVLEGQTVAGKYTALLPWAELASGNIIKMKITASGITASNAEMLLDE